MEFLVIGESKIKIVMSESDTKRFNIDTLSRDCTDPLCRRAVWSILDEARESVGFDPSGDKVLVQFYPTAEGGCEVFVTKLGILSGASAKIVSRSDKLALLSRERLLYSFDGKEPLILAAKAVINRCKLPPKSDLYLLSEDKYFLHVEEHGKGGESSEFPSILEFGRSIPTDFMTYLREHGTLLIKDSALERISLL